MFKKTIFKFAVVTTLLFISICGVLAPILSSVSFGWFAQESVAPTSAEVMPGFYAGGSGTVNDPYRITKPIHLYNLAWLQLRGEYNQQPLKQTYFELCDNLDMKGYVLPPIGTQDNPFIGVFQSSDGKSFNIANLTVSNVIDNGEIVKRPQGYSNITGVEIVGMFGVVGSYVDDGTYESIVPTIENFRLENPVIRTQTENSLAGLIAGCVNDGNVSNVGVTGGSLVSGAINNQGIYEDYKSVLSFYALIGNRSGSVHWEGIGRPGDVGGTIKVDVTDETTRNGINATSNHFAIPGSTEGRAYAVGEKLQATTDNKGIGRYVMFSKIVGFNLFNENTSLVTVGTRGTISGSFNSFTPNDAWLQGVNPNKINSLNHYDDFKKAVDNNAANYVLNTGGQEKDGSYIYPKPDALYEIQILGVNTKVPDNSIWFNPIKEGRGIISFYAGNQSGNKCKSIYRYKRINASTIDASTWQELRFDVSGPQNKSLAVFEFEITKDDLEYEYVIGSTDGTGDNIQFFFLALAGASASDGGKGGPGEIFNVNFIPASYDPAKFDGLYCPAGKEITIFYVDFKDDVTKNDLDKITFSRTSIDEAATAVVGDVDLGYDKYLSYTTYHYIVQAQT